MNFYIDFGSLSMIAFGSLLVGAHYGIDLGVAAFCFVSAIAAPFGFEE